MRHRKKCIELLKKYYLKPEQLIEKFLSDVPTRKKINDVIDALCLVVMGQQILQNGLKTIPQNPILDNKVILMRMVYSE